MNNNALVGTWKLVSWENKSLEGEITYPFGQDALGCIQYTADGYMAVSIMRAHRANFASADLLGGSVAEKVAAVESYFGYCGSYEFDGVRVIHRVQASLFPNWVGTNQERLVELAGESLVLSTHPMLLRGKEQIARLVWKRL